MKSKRLLIIVLIVFLIVCTSGCTRLDIRQSLVAGQIEYSEEYGNQTYQIAILEDGKIKVQGSFAEQWDFSEWDNMVYINIGELNAGAITNDSKVVVTGVTEYGATDVEDWEDVVMICFTAFSTYGLKKDGRVLTTRETNMDIGVPFEVDNINVFKKWRNIVYIDASAFMVAAVKKNGRIEIVTTDDLYFHDIKEWKNIKQVSINDRTIAGLTKDGEVLLSYGYLSSLGNSKIGKADHLKGAVKICVEDSVVVGLMPDGTLRVEDLKTSWQINEDILKLDGLTDVVDINSQGAALTILKEDGTILIAGIDD